MNRYDLFAALKPTRFYPSTPLALKMHDIKYQIALPVEVADSVAAQIMEPEHPFCRINVFSSPSGICRVREKPERLSFESDGIPAYAESRLLVEYPDREEQIGSKRLYLVATQEIADHLMAVAICGKIFKPPVNLWLLRHESFFRECGGFELLRAEYYFDEAERIALLTDLDPSRQPNKELRGRKTRFADLI